MPERHLRLVPPPEAEELIFPVWYFAPDSAGATEHALSTAATDQVVRAAASLKRERKGKASFSVFFLDRNIAGHLLQVARIFVRALGAAPAIGAPLEELSLNPRRGLPIADLLLSFYAGEKATRFVVVADEMIIKQLFGRPARAGVLYPVTAVCRESGRHEIRK